MRRVSERERAIRPFVIVSHFCHAYTACFDLFRDQNGAGKTGKVCFPLASRTRNIQCLMCHSRPQKPRYFWSAPRIATSGLAGQVQHRKSTIHGLPVTLRMLRVKSDKSDWFWFQSIVFTKPFKNRMSLDQARGRDFLVLTKRSAASGDENVDVHKRLLYAAFRI